MVRDQLLRRLQQRVHRGPAAAYVWWNGELLHVGEAIGRAAALSPETEIFARGDDVLVADELGREPASYGRLE
jgi:hypothetical protein